jgi:Uma2 family endonuclease
MTTREKLYTVEEFLEYADRPENQHKQLELVDGVIVEVPPPHFANSTIAGLIAHFLWAYVLENDSGIVGVPDGGFRLSENTVRVPDVSYVVKSRLSKIPRLVPDGPDLAVEVVSPSDERDVNEKLLLFIKRGTRLAWAVYPKTKTVLEFRPTPEGVLLNEFTTDDTLSGHNVLPGFELPVANIFPNIPYEIED